jgi:hypothetical protein
MAPGSVAVVEEPTHAHLAATADGAGDLGRTTAQQPVLSAAARIAGVEVSLTEQVELRERARKMFYHGYDSYMNNAFPEVSKTTNSLTNVHHEHRPASARLMEGAHLVFYMLSLCSCTG